MFHTCRFHHLLSFSSRNDLIKSSEEFVDYQLLHDDSIPWDEATVVVDENAGGKV